uniref:PSMD12/CSN4-like N-terminal domain-containing protein n=2 Tax=Palpitomonas bilix TaxID=652834 RepID=A0A7S3G839_9EUKA|mmetsp:Transcript_37818/g.97587  ORF Transcript_37818/g.97587 Transcript_37818/m.97587 type:complete len:351 (+) Transcript_37818:76-1128(+)
MEVDLMEMVSQQLPVLRDIALKEGKLEDAIESLLGLEKQARLAADLQATTAICLGIVDICKDAGNWRALAENVSLICKRRGQLKEAIVKTIQKCMEFVPLLPSKEEKLEYIEALRVVTAGRIHVELESARLTRILSTIREEEGKVAEAADILQEIQVETYGSMDKKEKLDFLLEQVRLCMDKGDFIRAAIINRKISTKAFDGVEFQDEKIRYYNQVVRYRLHEKDYLGVSKCYHAILHTPSVEAVEEKWIEALKYCVLFLALSSFGEESSDFIHRLLTTEKRLEELTSFRLLLKELSSSELVDWMGTEGKVTDMMALLPLFKQGLESYVSVLKTRILEHVGFIETRVVAC